MNEEQAFADFRKDSASYYAWFEKAAGPGKPAASMYESIPLQLASEINGEELDLSGCFPGKIAADEKHLTLWPQANGYDGFFIAAFRKEG